MALNIAWQPQPRQALALERSEREVLFGGARFGGKSEASRAWLCELDYIRNPRYMGLVVRKNATDLAEWIEQARIQMRPTGAAISGTPTTIKFPAGGIIWTGHLKDENAYGKYQGWNMQKILVEEITQIPREQDYEMLISSCRSGGSGLPAQVFATGNPGGPGHVWVKSRFRISKPYFPFKPFCVNPENLNKDEQIWRVFVPSKAVDNVIGCQNDPAYVAQLMSIRDDKLRAAWVDGDWDVFSGQFFDKWDESVHVIKPFALDPNWMRFRGLDWGYTAPSACGWWAVDYEGNHYKYREYYKNLRTPQQLAASILGMTDKDENIIKTLASPDIRADKQFGVGKYDEQATIKSIEQLLIEAGLYVTLANNDRESGWNNMRELMSWDANLKPKLFIFNTCTETIRVYPSLIHSNTKVEDVDKNCEDHIPESDRYCLMHTYKPFRPDPPKDEYEQFIEKITTPADGNDDWSRGI